MKPPLPLPVVVALVLFLYTCWKLESTSTRLYPTTESMGHLSATTISSTRAATVATSLGSTPTSGNAPRLPVASQDARPYDRHDLIEPTWVEAPPILKQQVLEGARYPWTPHAYGGGFQHSNDARYSKRATVVVSFRRQSIPSFAVVRETIGALHQWEWARRIALYLVGFSTDELNEASLFLHVVLFTMDQSMAVQAVDQESILHGVSSDLDEWISYSAFADASKRFNNDKCRMVPQVADYKSIIESDFTPRRRAPFEQSPTVIALVPGSNHSLPWDIGGCEDGGSIGVVLHPRNLTLYRDICDVDLALKHTAYHALQALPSSTPLTDFHRVRSSVRIATNCKTTALAPNTACVPDARSFRSLAYTARLTSNAELCGLQLRMRTPKPSQPPLPQRGKEKFCLCIATYSEQGVAPANQSLSVDVAATLGRTVARSLKDFDFYVYLGTQVDPLWDDAQQRKEMIDILYNNIATAVEEAAVKDAHFDIRTFRYSLSPGLRDIVYKFNAVIMQAYADGCDYMYQYSDDFQFLNAGWINALVSALKTTNLLGSAGMVDARREELGRTVLMTLGMTHRKHLDILGWFWPPRLKNWYSDNFIQELYGEAYLHFLSSHQVRNAESFGQRYSHCEHFREMNEEMARARAKIIKYLERELAEVNDQLKVAPELEESLSPRRSRLLEEIEYFTQLLNQLIDTVLLRTPASRNTRPFRSQQGRCSAILPTWDTHETLGLEMVDLG